MSDAPGRLVPITLEDLPRYSVWPKRLLSLEPYAVKHKTEAEVLREYQDEKWGGLLRQTESLASPTLRDIEQTYTDLEVVTPFYDAGKFYLASRQRVLNKHLDLYGEVLAPLVKGASCVVELGAGYGSKLFGLAARGTFASLPLMAAEYTQSGRDLLSLLAKSLRIPLAVGRCDFWKLRIDGITIPENSVIFTSYALHYVPKLPMHFVGFLSRLKPKVVVHFEPCYEHYNVNSLHGLMCRRYVELNDYTVNLAAVIEAGRRDCKDIAVQTRQNVIGSNPFLPISIIEWAPGQPELL